jgi:hypothetical protein
LRRKVGLALAFIVFGSIAGASGIFVQMADEPNTNGGSMIAAIPLNSSATLSTSIVSPASPAASAPDSRRDFALPSNSAQAAPVDAMTTAATEPAATATTAATEPAATATTAVTEPPVTATTAVTAASKKPQKTARSQNRRDRDLYDAYALRQQRADYGRGRVSGNNFSGAGW